MAAFFHAMRMGNRIFSESPRRHGVRSHIHLMSADRVLAAPYSAGLHDQNFESAQKILVVKAVEHDFYFASNSDV